MASRASGQDLLVGTELGHYRIVEKIGVGGMGQVYRARDEHLARDVAIKVLPPGTLIDESARKRFRKEALSLSKLNHPNIATIFDFDTDKDIDFLVMELIPGTTLADRVAAEWPLSESEIVRIGTQLAEGLLAAHQQGVIHCDLKPGNLRITPEGRLKILDFGLAKLVAPRTETAATESLTSTPIFAGTVPYMAPEQVRNEKLDVRVDIWAAGAVMYEMATGRTPFHSSSPVLTLAAVLEQKLVRPSTVNPNLSSGLQCILEKALAKDRDLRYQSAAELRDDLERLQHQPDWVLSQRDTFIARCARFLHRINPATIRRIITLGAAVAVLALATVWWRGRIRGSGMAAPRGNSIVVLPLQNGTGDAGADFLGMALADEIATTLTYTPALEVRPIPTSRAIAADPQQAAVKLRAATVVSGHYVRQEDRLLITVEAVEAGKYRLIWRETLTALVKDSISLQRQLATRVRQGLVPILVGRYGVIEAATRPNNLEAYELFLRSAALSNDRAPNDAAVAMLERSVALDANYAPAWSALGLRYYYNYVYGGGGTAADQRAVAATERALRLDPNLVLPAARLIRMRVERGGMDERAKAHQEAVELVRRRPENAQTHFTLAYALRYEGFLERSGRECDTALSLDPGNQDFRSCSFTFFQQGKLERAKEYLLLDEGSEWFRNVEPTLLLRGGNISGARESARAATSGSPWFGDVMRACLDSPLTPETKKLAREAEPMVMNHRDPEVRFYWGTLFAFCGQKEPALRLLNSAVAQNYCAYDALNSDPALAKLRGTSEFGSLQTAAHDCQQRLLMLIGRAGGS